MQTVLKSDDFQCERKGCSTTGFASYSSLIIHIGRAKDCKSFYGPEKLEAMRKELRNSRKRKERASKTDLEKEEILKKRRSQYDSEKEKARKKSYYKENPEKRKQKYHMTPEKQRQEINKNEYESKKQIVRLLPQEAHLDSYHKECRNTPIFPCICCHRLRYPKGVKIITIPPIQIKSDLFENSCTFDNSFMIRDNFHICLNCNLLLTDKTNPRRPKISAMNGLLVEHIPESLQLEDVENQLIAINLVFMKLKKLPKSRMGCMVDRVINVPLTDEQVTQSVKTLPRTLDDGFVVPIQFKRMKGMKNTVMEAFVRPKGLIKALETLKSLGNPHYQDVNIDFFLPQEDSRKY